jgi:hypothetical protein
VACKPVARQRPRNKQLYNGVIRQRPVNSNRRTVFSARFVPRAGPVRVSSERLLHKDYDRNSSVEKSLVMTLEGLGNKTARLSVLCAGRFLPPGRFLVLISVRGWVDPRATVRLKGLGQLKKSSGLIGNRTRDLPACSIMPQPTTLSRARRW